MILDLFVGIIAMFIISLLGVLTYKDLVGDKK